MKSNLRGAFITASILLVALPLSVQAAGDAVTITVTESTDARIMLNYNLGDYTITTLDIDGLKYAQVTLDREALIEQVGRPTLPHVCRSVIIPADAQMAVRVSDASYVELSGIDIAPSKGPLPRTINPADVPYTFAADYGVDAYYPAATAELGDPYILRNLRGTVVTFNPFQYNPVTHTLRVCTEATLEVAAVGTGGINVLEQAAAPEDESLAFQKIYQGHFLNYGATPRYAPLDETGDMLIIVHDAWIANVQPLANHKTARGIDTTIVGVATIGNNATAIKNYIQGVYSSSDLAFVLLVGDASQVATPSASGGSSDPTYSKLAGSDNYPDILVGRFSAENAGQVDTQVQRTIEYETMPAPTQEWFKKGVGIASNQGPGDDGEYDNQHMDNIRNDLLAYGYSEVDRIYDPTGTAGQVTAALNAGRGIINYVGHGSMDAWSSTGFSVTHVNNLVNDNMLPFITSVACVNGQFAGGTCFAEAWLRATHNGEPTGAIGIYASSINQSWNSPMAGQDEIIDRLVAESYIAYGALCYAGSCLMMDEYGGDGVDMFNTWHIFGDPSVRVMVTCLSKGAISLDSEKYGCDDTATIQVSDCDLNADSGAVETVTVNISSDSQPGGKSVLLTETGAETAIFQGVIDLSGAAGALPVAEGDTVTALYIDADNGEGGHDVDVLATAAVDCTPPAISGVETLDVEPRSATVAFDVDEPALGTVHYGRSCSALTSSAATGGFTASPVVTLTGLTDDTDYYYTIEAEDEAGNVATDDGGGACYGFTTPQVPDFYTELFESDNDLDHMSVMFFPDGSGDFYFACSGPLTDLPTDPSGGTSVSLDDDESVAVSLADGATISLYGVEYTTFYIVSNGYIVFVADEDDYSETLEEHFEIPRVAALYDDLNPSDGGTISWKQFEHSVAITWMDVPEYSSSTHNTFQIVMYFDGRIELNYLTIEAEDGLAGLSEGEGLDPDFLESDLSHCGDCVPPCVTSAACPDADVNCDSITDGFDIAVIRNTLNWLKTSGAMGDARADVNGDGIVDGFDIAVVRNTVCWLH